jgi:hypothetical protein
VKTIQLDLLGAPPKYLSEAAGARGHAASAAPGVTTLEAPQAEVERVADLLFNKLPQRPGGSDVVKVSAGNALRGVTIPLHPGAEQTTPGPGPTQTSGPKP